MCACRDRDGGLRNKRKLTKQEAKALIEAREEGLKVSNKDHCRD
jgi:hypothetical protein